MDSNPLDWTDSFGLAKDKNKYRRTECKSKDKEECQKMCSPRGVASCRKVWMLGTEIVGGEVVEGWKSIGRSCECEETFCDKHPNVCALGRGIGYAILGAVAVTCAIISAPVSAHPGVE